MIAMDKRKIERIHCEGISMVSGHIWWLPLPHPTGGCHPLFCASLLRWYLYWLGWRELCFAVCATLFIMCAAYWLLDGFRVANDVLILFFLTQPGCAERSRPEFRMMPWALYPNILSFCAWLSHCRPMTDIGSCLISQWCIRRVPCSCP